MTITHENIIDFLIVFLLLLNVVVGAAVMYLLVKDKNDPG